MRPKIVLYYNDLLFQPSETFLFKDFGQVPYVMSELYSADVKYWISASRTNPGFTSFRGKPVRQFGKSLRWLPNRLDRFRNGDLYRAIDREPALTHLIVFPFTPSTDLKVAKRVRHRHPDARIILKLDTNREYLERIAADWARYRAHPARLLRQCHYYRQLLQMADLVLCETSDCDRILRDGFLGLDLADKLTQTFSGLSESWIASIGVSGVPAASRRPAIVVSGRISSRQKYTSLIFDAGPPPPGWMIEFIGEVDNDLAAVIDAHRAVDPQFDAHYRFHGAITDKRAYFDILMHAQALLMNSRGGEGFPNVFAEAHYCRLLIITSDVSGAGDATDGGRFGLVYAREDAAALRAALHAVPARIADAAHQPARERYRRRFIWEHSLDQPAIRRLFGATARQIPVSRTAQYP